MAEKAPSSRFSSWRRPVLRLLSYARRAWRRVENFVFGLVLTLIALYFVLQLPVVQNWLIGKVTNYLSEELNTTVTVRHIDISLFDNLVLEGFFVADLHGDTLLYADKLTAGLNSNIFTVFRNKLEFNEISLEKARFNILRAEGEQYNNLHFVLDYLSSPKSRKKQDQTPFRIRVQNLRLIDVEFLQDDRVRGQRLFFHVSAAYTRVNNLDFVSKIADLQFLNCEGLRIRVEEFERRPLPGSANRKSKPVSIRERDSLRQATEPFRVKIGRFLIQNSRFNLDRYDNSPARANRPGVMDFEHLAVRDIDIQAEDFYFDDQLTFRGRLIHLAAREECGFQLSHGAAREVVVCDTLAGLYGVRIETPGSTLGDTLAFHYTQYRDFRQFTDRVRMEGRFKEGTKLRLGDLMYFSPNLETNRFFLQNRDLQAQFSGDMEGRVNRLRGRNLFIRLGDDTYMRGSFDGQNLAEGQDRLVLDFDFEPLQSNMRTISNILPGFSAPAQFGKLGNIQFDGTYQIIFGFNHIVNGKLNSDIGYGHLDMELDLTRGREKARYSGFLNMQEFNLAAWTSNRNFGRTSFNVRIEDGSGLTLPTVNATVSGVVDTFYFNGYNYRNIEMNGKFAQYIFSGQLGITDPNVDFQFDGTVSFKDSIPVYVFTADLNRLDLGALNLVEKDWVLSGQVKQIRMQARTLDDVAGLVTLRNLRLIENRETVYELDSLMLASVFLPNGNRYMLFGTDVADAKIEGRFDFATAPGNLMKLFSRHYPTLAAQLGFPPPDSAAVADDQYAITLRIRDTRNLTRLFAPDLDTLRDIKAFGEVNAAKGWVNFKLDAPWLRYDGILFDSLHFDWNSLGSEGSYNISLENVFLANGQRMAPIRLGGAIRPNALQFVLHSRDLADTTALINNINLNGTLSATPDSLWQIQFDPSDIALFNEQWGIEANNFVRFGHEFFSTQNFQLYNGNQRILLDSINRGRGLSLALTKFDLTFLNKFFKIKDITYRGTIEDFDIKVQDIFRLTGFDLAIGTDTVFLNETPYGKITGNFEMADLNAPLTGKMFLQGPMNVKTQAMDDKQTVRPDDVQQHSQLRIVGAWLPGSAQAPAIVEDQTVRPGEMQVHVTTTNFPVSIAELFIPSISETAGAFNADVRLGGAPDRLSMQGHAQIRHAKFKIDYLNTVYLLHDQRVLLNSYQVWADSGMTIWDYSDRNKAFVTGGLRHNFFRDWRLDCTIETEGDNFTVLNTYKENNELYYGQGIGYFWARFTGSFSRTNIEITARTGSQTRLYIPISTASDAPQEIDFIKFRNKNPADSLKRAADGAFRIQDLRGLNFEMNITVTDEAEVQLIFDEQAGDIIKGRGEGDITLTINREGEFKMLGGYTIRRGEYLFTLLNLVNKPFTVANGGTITWSGNPYEAQINLDATYEENTSVYNFISAELALITSEANPSREATQATRVIVTMHLKGNLLKPNITFNLDFPNLSGQVKTLVENKLRQLQQDQNEMNRQVFGLVVVGSFLPSGGDYNPELIQASAFNTLTQVLSNQFSSYLTGLAAEWFGTTVSSIDLDVAYNEYQNDLKDPNLTQSQVGRELQVRLTSGFANDRVTIQFGSQFGLGRPGTTVQDGFLGEDVTVEIQLTENRQWRLKVYQRTEPDIAIGQRRSRYGFGISFRKDYDSFDDMMKGISGVFKKRNRGR